MVAQIYVEYNVSTKAFTDRGTHSCIYASALASLTVHSCVGLAALILLGRWTTVDAGNEIGGGIGTLPAEAVDVPLELPASLSLIPFLVDGDNTKVQTATPISASAIRTTKTTIVALLPAPCIPPEPGASGVCTCCSASVVLGRVCTCATPTVLMLGMLMTPPVIIAVRLVIASPCPPIDKDVVIEGADGSAYVSVLVAPLFHVMVNMTWLLLAMVCDRVDT